jgi:hypothetical protein
MAYTQNIDSMKALIGKRGGLARGNRFGIQIHHPANNQIINRISKLKSLYSEIPSEYFDTLQEGNDVYMLCSAVTLPGKRISTMEAKHNHNLSKKPYSMATDEVSTTFLLTSDYFVKKYFDIWQEMIVDSTGNHYKTMYKEQYAADITIHALDGTEKTNVGYTNILENAYPIQVGAIELGNAQEGLMELTVTWEYDNWKMQEENENYSYYKDGERDQEKFDAIRTRYQKGLMR